MFVLFITSNIPFQSFPGLSSDSIVVFSISRLLHPNYINVLIMSIQRPLIPFPQYLLLCIVAPYRRISNPIVVKHPMFLNIVFISQFLGNFIAIIFPSVRTSAWHALTLLLHFLPRVHTQPRAQPLSPPHQHTVSSSRPRDEITEYKHRYSVLTADDQARSTRHLPFKDRQNEVESLLLSIQEILCHYIIRMSNGLDC